MFTSVSKNHTPASAIGEVPPRFVYVGRLSVEKGLDVIFKAFHIQPFHLSIIGDGPLRSQVEAFAQANPTVEYLGFQNKDTIQKVLKNSSALLFCSKCYEGMPMTILESFANGTPVIASSLGCIPDIVTDKVNGLLFKNNDAKDLSHKIQQWVTMPGHKRHHYHSNTLETFHNKFSADANFLQLMSIYDGIIRNHN